MNFFLLASFYSLTRHCRLRVIGKTDTRVEGRALQLEADQAAVFDAMAVRMCWYLHCWVLIKLQHYIECFILYLLQMLSSPPIPLSKTLYAVMISGAVLII